MIIRSRRRARRFEIIAKGKQIPEWTLDRFGLCAVLQPSPARSDQPVENVTLIPMGAARLRISAFPTVSAGPDAHQWLAPAAAQAAGLSSHRFALSSRRHGGRA